jgi:decaprenylphospho-beta-D-ribofuranose 2-oxidase
MNWAEIELTGWGRSARVRSMACRPERANELAAAVASATVPGGIIAYGAGRSYGDAALNSGGMAVITTRLDRILAFDPETGDVVCEPGVTFRDLIDTFVPLGFMPPTSPGTSFTTVGGALANDVHGKNHDRHGSFGNHVHWFDILLADGSWRRVTPDDDPELFAATIGGVGLTGLISAVAFRLLPGATPVVNVNERRIPDLDAFLAAFAEAREKATFSVGWIDALATGRGFGRGILETAEFATGAEPKPPRPRKVPFDFPSFALHPLVVQAHNVARYLHIPSRGRERLRRFDVFLYPLDAIHDWNRLYGKRGFYQFQCVLPDASAEAGLKSLLSEISHARAASPLAVLKTLGGMGRGLLSFPMRGFTLALDFPRRTGTAELLRRLEDITLEHGGRIYLAKDSVLSREALRTMYPDLPRLEAVLARVDPESRFTSDMARRLGIKPGNGAAA